MTLDASEYEYEQLDVESEEDLEIVNPEEFRSITVSPLELSVSTVLQLLQDNRIDLRPSFQRRSAWESRRKSQYIESLMIGLPTPQIVLAEDRNRGDSFIVIDGKQRLLTLKEFCTGPGATGFKLRDLSYLKDLAGKTYDDLCGSLFDLGHARALQQAPVRAMIIRKWGRENLLWAMFLRLNRGSKPLSPQELRQAMHPGAFLDFLDRSCDGHPGVHLVLGIDRPDFRMRDVELMLRFIAFRNRLVNYDGNLKRFLDDTAMSVTKKWDELEPGIRTQLADLDAAINTTVEVFKDNSFALWRNGRFEYRRNRAVFDVMTYYFCVPRVREQASAKAGAIHNAFTSLCDVDESFVEALTTTTKSVAATAYRLRAWGLQLAKALGAALPIPDVKDNRIILGEA